MPRCKQNGMRIQKHLLTSIVCLTLLLAVCYQFNRSDIAEYIRPLRLEGGIVNSLNLMEAKRSCMVKTLNIMYANINGFLQNPKLVFKKESQSHGGEEVPLSGVFIFTSCTSGLYTSPNLQNLMEVVS